MYHTIAFAAERLIDLEVSRKQPLEQVLIKAETRPRAD
jgi:hypothetical protein